MKQHDLNKQELSIPIQFPIWQVFLIGTMYSAIVFLSTNSTVSVILWV
jgi:hypothetical protein